VCARTRTHKNMRSSTYPSALLLVCTPFHTPAHPTGHAAVTACLCCMQERQFKPVPFGFPAPPSAFTLASAPEHAAVWEHFRSIDSDKEARVLQVCVVLGAALVGIAHTRDMWDAIQPMECSLFMFGGPSKVWSAPPCQTQHPMLAESAP
jgi:hypothetical protein